MRSARTLGFLVTLFSGLLVSGCATAMTPVWGLYTDVKGPLQATSLAPGGGQARGTLPAGTPTDQQVGAAGTAPTGLITMKTGAATATSILGIVATGDASIEAAARNGGITKIHHVDHHTRNIILLYSEFTTVVYGE